MDSADLTHDVTTNNPPEPTPLERAKEEISLLDMEAANWFDGAQIENETQAAAVAKLLDDARKASGKFTASRKEEKKPHDDAAKAVDASWKPVIADADRIVECAKKAQTKWLIKLDEEQRAAAESARREAEEKEAEARRLATEADGSLAAAKARDDAIKESQAAARAAGRAEHEAPRAKGGGMSRAIGLRTVYRAQVDDRRLLLNHIATTDAAALTAFVEGWAAQMVRAGKRTIPGVTVIEDRVAA